MIKITDNIETISIASNELKFYDKYYEGLQIKPIFAYWVVELIIVIEDNILGDIIKVYNGGEEILDRFVNKMDAKDTILLSEKDFQRFKKIYNNMRIKKDYRKSAVVSAYAKLLSYEYFQATNLEDTSVTLEELFADLNGYNYEIYQKEIIKEAKKLLNNYKNT